MIEREPFDRPVADLTWGELTTDDEVEFTLHVEEPVASKRVVPVERVRLHRDRVRGDSGFT